jgi:lipid-binding SYLF domain-containing protein
MMASKAAVLGFKLAGATDFVLVMNGRGAHAIPKSKVKLGARSAAAGPKGRNAEASTDVTMR